jgi:hypothetical protein
MFDFYFKFLKITDPVAGRQEGEREINECYCKTKKNQSWGMLSGDQKRVT